MDPSNPPKDEQDDDQTQEQPGDHEEDYDSREQRHRLDRLSRRYQFLETLFALTVSALILLVLGVNLFLYKHTRLFRTQLAGQREGSRRASEDFHKIREPIIRNFTASLTSFADTNPDFRPTLNRYSDYLGKYFNAPLTPGPPASTNAPPE